MSLAALVCDPSPALRAAIVARMHVRAELAATCGVTEDLCRHVAYLLQAEAAS